MAGSLQSWARILGLGTGGFSGEDPRATLLFLAQSLWVGVDRLRGIPREEILARLQEREGIWVAFLAFLTLAAAATALWVLARRDRVPLLGCGLLCLSPLWLHEIFEPAPAVLWGLALVLLFSSAAPTWAQIAALGLLAGTHPLGIPLAAGALLAAAIAPAGGMRLRWATILILALPVACLWNPRILIDWGGWLEATLWSLGAMGWSGPLPEVVVNPDPLLPPSIGKVLTGGLLARSLGPVVFLLLPAGLVRLLRSPREARSILSAIVVASLLLGAIPGRMERVVFIGFLPILAHLCAEGGLWIWRGLRAQIQPGARRAAAAVALGSVLLPVGIRGMTKVSAWRLPSGEQAAIDWLRLKVREGAWIVMDERSPEPPAGWPPSDETGRTRVLRIPHHPLRPDLHRAAYWLGWYAPFDMLVISARTVGPLVEERRRFPDILDFYTRALVELDTLAMWGGEGWRDARISVMALPGDTLGAGWRTRLAAGPRQGLQPDFLALLGGTLADRGRKEEALALLDRARELGGRSRSLYLHLGTLHLSEGRHADAEAILVEGMERWPDDPDFLRLRAANFARRGLWRRSADAYARLLQAAPWDDQARLDLAAALLMGGRRERARLVLADYLKRTSPDERPADVERLIEGIFPGGLPER